MFTPGDDAALREVPDDVRSQSLVLLETERWLVGVPLTPSAASWWGAWTDWCTGTDATAFLFYHRQGPLVVFQRREASWRWQLHPPTGEFRDMRNRPASFRDFLAASPELVTALVRCFARGLWGTA